MSERGRRSQLGRGLAALFGEGGARLPAAAGTPRPMPIAAIRPARFQPRRHFPEAELEELAQSIRAKGLLQPLLVRPIPESEEGSEEDAEGGPAFELVAGERRWRAAQRALLHEVPVIIRELSDGEALEIALVENLQRADLAPLDEAEAYRRLTREFGRSQSEIGDAIGRSRSHVANTIRLLSLPEPVRRRLDDGALSAGHARALLAAPDPAALAGEIIRRGLNVRATEDLVRRRAARPKMPRQQPRDADVAALEGELGTALGLRVVLSQQRRGGSLTLYYRSLDQLDRLLALLRAG